ncbi:MULTISPECIES: Hpt domain-containing protein [Rhodopseudomonas]|uniref:Histidine kinase n=1 Tax=Rhodopseudomonas palustris TaxID=1076 RepID=A0A0D7DXR7_RHOPL|nr:MULTISPECIES: Hpt domain-containing protein [Rhodopseudomonas]KIZ32995.1 histidine kinase [Rhodopseudomonas palustris]MDF3813830.1 Hpt domain-containing protein [Rhodopseudomonas sp. BAL398]WOK18437.1 Hpt domain-containing protein [Rhodopseudomonas sp. BAL398]
MAKTPRDVQIETFADYQLITQPNPLRKVLRRVADKDLDDPVARAERALAKLSSEFGAWMADECARLAAAHAAIIADGVNDATRDELFRAAHDIKGDAATFGFPHAAIAAESLCRVIEHAPDLARVPEELIANHVKAIHAIVRARDSAGNAGIERELNKRLRLVADEYLAAVNRDRPEHLEAILAPGIAPAE